MEVIVVLPIMVASFYTSVFIWHELDKMEGIEIQFPSSKLGKDNQ